jgi:hypothetical protein
MNYSATQRQEIGIPHGTGREDRRHPAPRRWPWNEIDPRWDRYRVIASLVLTRVMASLLFGVTATDLPTFLGVSAVLTIVAFLANYIRPVGHPG